MTIQEKKAAQQAQAAQAKAARELKAAQAKAAQEAAQATIDAIAQKATEQTTTTKAVSIVRKNLVAALKESIDEAKSLSARFKVLRQKFPFEVKDQIFDWQDKGTKVNQDAVQRILVQGDLKLFANYMTDVMKEKTESGENAKKTFTESEMIGILKRAVCATNEDIATFDLVRSEQAAQ